MKLIAKIEFKRWRLFKRPKEESFEIVLHDSSSPVEDNRIPAFCGFDIGKDGHLRLIFQFVYEPLDEAIYYREVQLPVPITSLTYLRVLTRIEK